MKKSLFVLFLTVSFEIFAQNNTTYWQQHVDYKMDVHFNVNTFQYTGTQKLIYTNNSPDVLNQVFYHLYFNAFQPGSEMDTQLQAIVDPDSRMVTSSGTSEKPIYHSRIANLKPSEIGFLNVKSLTQNEKPVKIKIEGTILQVFLNEPIQPGEKVMFDMNFEGQLPVHIRRAGRKNEDGVAISMAQWYPKMAEYDFEGWHADPYIGREFYGVWGDFDITLKIDKNYTVAGTGYLKNPQEVGHGYENTSKKLELQKGNELTWHFVAPNVHDFTWAADPNYAHDILNTKNGTSLHFFYKNTDKYKNAWKAVQPYTAKALDFYNEQIGIYPWKQYSVIQGGDGGMEYSMCTLVAGGEKLNDILGTVLHELAHEWFQQLLATNESEHAWMDEGFTTYISTKASDKLIDGGAGNFSPKNYKGYFYLVNARLNEPLTTHSDRYKTNVAYSVASYTMGSMFLSQLDYIIGNENVSKTLKAYYRNFKFKHPTPNDFIRTAEKISGLQLGWYLNEWIETTHTIDYGIKSVDGKMITLERIGEMPMPVDIQLIYTDGTTENFNIPLRMMRGAKPTSATILTDWAWAMPTYSFTVSKEIAKIEIDPLELMADINKENNFYKK